MKKLLLTMLMIAVVSGCDSQKKEAKFEGVPSGKKDYIAQGVKYLNPSDVQKAVQSFDLAIRQEPTNVQNYMVLGEVYLRLKEYARAVDTFTAATRIAPNDGEVFYFLGVSKALKSKIEKTPKAAEDSFKEAIAATQKSVEIFMNQKNDKKFRQSVALLKSLTQGGEVKATAQSSVSDILPQPEQQ